MHIMEYVNIYENGLQVLANKERCNSINLMF